MEQSRYLSLFLPSPFCYFFWPLHPLARKSSGPYIPWPVNPLVRTSFGPYILWSIHPLVRTSFEPLRHLTPKTLDPYAFWSLVIYISYGAIPLFMLILTVTVLLFCYVLWTLTSFGPLRPFDPYVHWTLTSFGPLRPMDPYVFWTLMSFGTLRLLDSYVF
jgi:hypothetical protein